MALIPFRVRDLLSDSADQTSAYSGSLWNLRRRFSVDILKWGIKTFVKTSSFSGYLTQNRLSFSLKQGTKPDKNLFQKFFDAQDPY